MQTLNDRKRAIIDKLLRSAVTNSEYDRAQVALLLQVARANGFYDEALKMAMKHRSEWLDWLTISQRQWQRRFSRRSSKLTKEQAATRRHYVEFI